MLLFLISGTDRIPNHRCVNLLILGFISTRTALALPLKTCENNNLNLFFVTVAWVNKHDRMMEIIPLTLICSGKKGVVNYLMTFNIFSGVILLSY